MERTKLGLSYWRIVPRLSRHPVKAVPLQRERSQTHTLHRFDENPHNALQRPGFNDDRRHAHTENRRGARHLAFGIAQRGKDEMAAN
nr:hypothetical protein [Bosea sp. Root483D1]